MQYLNSIIIGLLISMLAYQPLEASKQASKSDSTRIIQQTLKPAFPLDDALSKTLDDDKLAPIVIAEKDTIIIIQREPKKEEEYEMPAHAQVAKIVGIAILSGLAMFLVAALYVALPTERK